MSKKYSNAAKTISSKEGRHQFKKEMLDEVKSKKAFDIFKGISKFDAIVLDWHNYLDSSGADTGTAGAGTGNMYLACYVRPIDIEGFLIPPPCSSKNPEMQRCIISLHPVAFSTHAILDGRETSMKVGDVVTCYFADKGPEFQGNLKGLRFESSQQKTAVGGFSLECLERDKSKGFDVGDSLKKSGGPAQSTGNIKPVRTWVATNSKKEDAKWICPGQPVNEKTPKCKCASALKPGAPFEKLPRQTTTFFYYNRAQVKQLIQNTGASADVQKIMWCFGHKEQPFNKGKNTLCNLPNNNPSGIQTDSGGWGARGKLINYHSCFKDSKQFRGFAGFNDPQDGYEFFKLALMVKLKGSQWQKKDKSGPNYPTGTIDEQAETLTWLYYRNWNIRANDILIERMRTTPKWASTKKTFIKALKIFWL